MTIGGARVDPLTWVVTLSLGAVGIGTENVATPLVEALPVNCLLSLNASCTFALLGQLVTLIVAELP
jgi:hypothetical protein